MVDILFLLGERPPIKGDHKRFNVIQKACRNILDDYNIEYRFVVQTPNPDIHTKENIKKDELISELPQLYDYIEKNQPRLIVAMGKHAFEALYIDNTKISEIQCSPVHSPIFGNKVTDLRKTKKEKQASLMVSPRGVLAVKGHQIEVSAHDPLIWPMHNHSTFFAYGSGYKAMTYFEDQLKCIRALMEEEDKTGNLYEPHMPSWFDKYINYYPDPNKAIAKILELCEEEKISFDIETAGPGVPRAAQLNPEHPDAKITCIAIGAINKTTKKVDVHVFDTLNQPEIIPYMKQLMRTKSTKFTWNGKFDINFIGKLWNTHVQGKHIDGMRCLHLYDMGRTSVGAGSSTLKTNSSLYLSPKFAGYHKHNFLDKAMKMGDGDFIGQHWQAFLQYCGIDVFVTYHIVTRLWNRLAPETKNLAITHYEDLTETLNEMHDKGMKIETKLLDKYITELKAFCEALSEKADDEVHKIMQRYNVEELSTCKGGKEFSIQSKQNIAEIMYDILGIPPELTEKGNYTVNKEVLEKHQKVPFVEIVLTYNYFVQQLRLLETLRGHTDEEGYCYPFYDDMRTASGRLSCRNPNIQQMSAMAVKATEKQLPRPLKEYDDLLYKVIAHRPVWKNHSIETDDEKKKVTVTEYSPKVKKVVVAPEGYTLIYADYAQIEVYVLGNYISFIGSPDINLQSALIKGLDIHSFTTSNIYTILKKTPYSYDFIVENKEELPYKLWRGNAKTVLFSLIYGKGYRTFAREQEVDEDDAKALFDVFLEGFPGIQDYMRWAEKETRMKGETSTVMGHRRKIGILKYERRNKKGINQAYNTPIQGSAGTFVLCALNKLRREIAKIGGRPAFTVHDSVGIYVPNDKVDLGIEIMRWCMEEYPSIEYNDFLMIPLRIDLEVCNPSWADGVKYELDKNPYYKKLYVKDKDNEWKNSELA